MYNLKGLFIGHKIEIDLILAHLNVILIVTVKLKILVVQS